MLCWKRRKSSVSMIFRHVGTVPCSLFLIHVGDMQNIAIGCLQYYVDYINSTPKTNLSVYWCVCGLCL